MPPSLPCKMLSDQQNARIHQLQIIMYWTLWRLWFWMVRLRSCCYIRRSLNHKRKQKRNSVQTSKPSFSLRACLQNALKLFRNLQLNGRLDQGCLPKQKHSPTMHNTPIRLQDATRATYNRPQIVQKSYLRQLQGMLEESSEHLRMVPVQT